MQIVTGKARTAMSRPEPPQRRTIVPKEVLRMHLSNNEPGTPNLGLSPTRAGEAVL
jgi:hypothetical protein